MGNWTLVRDVSDLAGYGAINMGAYKAGKQSKSVFTKNFDTSRIGVCAALCTIWKSDLKPISVAGFGFLFTRRRYVIGLTKDE